MNKRPLKLYLSILCFFTPLINVVVMFIGLLIFSGKLIELPLLFEEFKSSYQDISIPEIFGLILYPTFILWLIFAILNRHHWAVMLVSSLFVGVVIVVIIRIFMGDYYSQSNVYIYFDFIDVLFSFLAVYFLKSNEVKAWYAERDL